VRNQQGRHRSPLRLPPRWAITGLITGTADTACFVADRIIAAVAGAIAVAAALHSIPAALPLVPLPRPVHWLRRR
jgi:hypothetical protein